MPVRKPLSMRKRGVVVRILITIMDGEPHRIGEFYNYIAQAVEPPTAIQKYIDYTGGSKRSDKLQKRQNYAILHPEETMIEGRRLAIMYSIRHMEKKGWITTQWPESQIRNPKGPRGFIDVTKAVIQLTKEGEQVILNKKGLFGKITNELRVGMIRGELWLKPEILFPSV